MLRYFSVICSALWLLSEGGNLCAETVRFRLDVADVLGNPVTSVTVGQSFLLQTFVQDVSDGENLEGVFAAYQDLAYDPHLASVAGEIQHGPDYPNGLSGDVSTPGLFDDIGAFAGFTPLGKDEFLLYSIPMTAVGAGMLEFVGASSENSPTLDVLVYGLNDAVAPSDVNFGQLRVGVTHVVPEPSGAIAALSGLLLLIPRIRRRKRYAAALREPRPFLAG